MCGGTEFTERTVLWPELIERWGLAPDDVKLVDRQQGLSCRTCACSLRSMTLAGALHAALDWRGSLQELLTSEAAFNLRLLEINTAGMLHDYLRLFPQHRLASYPQMSIEKLAFADDTFDVVMHSDTLEHVPDPIQGLRECWRVLRPGGVLLMTIPIVPTRLSRRCSPSLPSYHNSEQPPLEDYRVITEYGADFYLEMLAAGWNHIALFSLCGAASIAVSGIKQCDEQARQARPVPRHERIRQQARVAFRLALSRLARTRSVVLARRAVSRVRRNAP